MNEEKRAKIERLAGLAHDASEARRMHELSGRCMDPAKRREQAIAYALAKAQEAEELDALGKAMKP